MRLRNMDIEQIWTATTDVRRTVSPDHPAQYVDEFIGALDKEERALPL